MAVGAYLSGAMLISVLAGCAGPAGAGAPAAAPAGEDAQARCSAAMARFRSVVGAAGETCLSDAGCEAFDSCYAVVRGHAAAPMAARADAELACRDLPGGHASVGCAGRPVRCVAGRCLRF